MTGDFTFHGVTKSVTAQTNITGQGKGAKGEVRTSAEVSPFYLNRFSAPLLPNTLLLEGV